MKDQKVIDDQALVDRLETQIYNTYYKNNPQGDARFDLWPQVLEAKKSQNPVKELESILESLTN